MPSPALSASLREPRTSHLSTGKIPPTAPTPVPIWLRVRHAARSAVSGRGKQSAESKYHRPRGRPPGRGRTDFSGGNILPAPKFIATWVNRLSSSCHSSLPYSIQKPRHKSRRHAFHYNDQRHPPNRMQQHLSDDHRQVHGQLMTMDESHTKMNRRKDGENL